MTATNPTWASLAIMLRALKLATVRRHAEEVAQQAERDGWTFDHYLHHLVELEIHERRRRRIERNLKDSDLPADKTLATLNRSRLPTKVAKQVATLCEGSFVERGDNLLAFGLPGRGKTHLVCAIGHELIQRGYRVLFTATYALVQRLLVAKRDLRLEDELAVLDGFDAVLCDDIGYVQQNRDEMEVLFTFLAERYERRTVIITSNLVFSEWDRIFKDPMTTAAAIDRLVHHAVILEMTGKSIRIEDAQAEQRTIQGTTPTSSATAPTTQGESPAPTTATPPTTATLNTNGAPTTTTPLTTTPTNTNGAPTTTTPLATSTTQGGSPPTTATPNTNRAPTTTTGATTTTQTPATTTTSKTTTPTTQEGAPPPTTAIPNTNGAPTTIHATRNKNRNHSRKEDDGEM